MSAICGIFNRNGRPVKQQELQSMSDSMLHRGPDAQRVWIDGALGLAQRMLQTTPESLHEKLPYEDRESGLVITADARIDNRDELGGLLGIAQRVNDGLPDSRIILAAYKKWGEKCVDYLLGDFAFVIWDKRCRKLFCARDHLGVRPFLYHASASIFAFASEVRAINRVDQIPRRINEGRITDFFIRELEGIDKTSTFYEEIFRLPPAHTMVVSDGKVVINCYWELDPNHELHLGTDAEYVEVFQEIFQKSVNARLRCNGQAASMLSGGLDSSAIVGVARELTKKSGGEPLRVYSGVSDDQDKCVESSFRRSVVEQGGLDAISITPADVPKFADRLSQVYNSLGEPFDAFMTLNILIYLHANENGNRVMLDGVEGDMVHSLSPNYPTYLLRRGQFIESVSEIRGLWRNYYRKMRPQRPIWGGAIRGLAPNSLRCFSRYLKADKALERRLRDSLIDIDFAHRTNIKQRLQKLRSHSCQGVCKSLRLQHIRLIMHPYLTTGLERYDRVAALCSVEPRHPLLDKRLVELSVSLPWNQLIRKGWWKYTLRRASEHLLPHDVTWRKGQEHIGWDFSEPWMLLDTELNHDKIISVHDHYVPKDEEYLRVLPACDSTGGASGQESWNVFVMRRWLDTQ